MKKHDTSLADIAAIAGVSQMTVSRALAQKPGVSQATREEILRLAMDMGYVAHRVKQKQPERRSQILGLITAEVHNPFISELVAGIGRAARTAGYELLVYALVDADQPPLHKVLQPMQQLVDGIIATLPRDFRYLEALARSRVPILTIDHHGQNKQFPSIAADSYAGASAAMRYLLAQGHRRIAFITGDERLASAQDRHRAWQEHLLHAGLPVDPELVVQGDFSQTGGESAAAQLLGLANRPTAIFAANDVSAIGVLNALHKAGLRVPEDISVVGFDDIPPAAQCHPPLTTVRQPMQQMGRAAVNTLLALMAGLDAASPQIVLPTELVLRQSSGPAPAQAG